MKTSRLYFSGLALLSALAGSAYAATPAEDVLQAFTACDGEFFHEFKKNLGSMSKNGTTAENANVASFAVENREQIGKQNAKFQKPVAAFNLTLSGYFDEITPISADEQYYFWGFFVAEPLAEVRDRLLAHIKDSARLKAAGSAFARLEIRDGNKWVNIEAPEQFSGKVPGKHVERILLIEESDDAAFPGTRLSCSLQGDVPASLLTEARPDLTLRKQENRGISVK